MRMLRGFWVAVTIALVACRSDGGGEAAIRVDTLPGGAVVVHNPDRGLWDEDEGWRLVEELRIGRVDAEGPEIFGDIRGLAVDAYGRIYVMDHHAHEIRVFDADGQYVRTIGRAGEGPGEFRGVYGGAFDPDWNLWVFDQPNSRYTVFDTTGGLLATHRREISGYGYRWQGLFDERGRLLESALLPGDERPKWGLLVFARSASGVGAMPDTTESSIEEGDPELASVEGGSLGLPDTVRFDDSAFEGRALEGFRFETERGFMVMGVPFAPGLHRLIDEAGTEWVGFSDEYRIARRSLVGDTLRIVQKEHRLVPVSDENLEEAMQRFDRSHVDRALVDTSRIPDVHPAYEFFLVEDGRLWVALPEDPDEPGMPLDVFDREGRYLGHLRSPVEFRAFSPWVARDDRLYVVARDEFDVPYVVRLRIERDGEG